MTTFSLNSSFQLLLNSCYTSEIGISAFSTISITYIIFLPIPILVLYLGFQKWRKQRSTSTSTKRHSELFIHHSIIMHMTEILGFTLYFSGGYNSFTVTWFLGLCIWTVTSLGHSLFHLMTCVERYMAVVHPVTYLSLRQTRGLMLRNISIGCVWVLSFGWFVVYFLCSGLVNLILYLFIMACFIAVISFFSISVLCALKRPGPGEVGQNRERVDKSKERAFRTIIAIMVVLMFRIMGNLLYTILEFFHILSDVCAVTLATMWFALPSSLVLPLLFLHREGKLKCCT